MLTAPCQALIARFDNSSDSGIFMVKDMLTKYLGFEAANVEMLYYDVDVGGGGKSLTGCHPAPTAGRFKEKLVEMLAGAQPGDVRFLYVDAQGTQKGGDDCKPDDGKNGGWMCPQLGMSTIKARTSRLSATTAGWGVRSWWKRAR